jgi:hypothetical protein
MGRPLGVRPDTDRLRELIRERGYRSVSAFARTRAKPRTLINVVCGGQRTSEVYMRRLAKTFGVDVSELILTEASGSDGQQEPDGVAA